MYNPNNMNTWQTGNPNPNITWTPVQFAGPNGQPMQNMPMQNNVWPNQQMQYAPVPVMQTAPMVQPQRNILIRHQIRPGHQQNSWSSKPINTNSHPPLGPPPIAPNQSNNLSAGPSNPSLSTQPGQGGPKNIQVFKGRAVQIDRSGYAVPGPYKNHQKDEENRRKKQKDAEERRRVSLLSLGCF